MLHLFVVTRSGRVSLLSRLCLDNETPLKVWHSLHFITYKHCWCLAFDMYKLSLDSITHTFTLRRYEISSHTTYKVALHRYYTKHGSLVYALNSALSVLEYFIEISKLFDLFCLISKISTFCQGVQGLSFYTRPQNLLTKSKQRRVTT